MVRARIAVIFKNLLCGILLVFAASQGALANEEADTWLDGEALRYALDPVREALGERADPLLERLQNVLLKKQEEVLRVTIFFSEEFFLKIQDEELAKEFSIYKVRIPKTVRFSVRLNDGVLIAQGFSQDWNCLKFWMKIPWFFDGVYLRSFALDMGSDEIRVRAGVVGNSVGIVAKGQWTTQRLEGVEILRTILENLAVGFPLTVSPVVNPN